MVLFFVLEGGIGIGKSTLVKKLCEIALISGLTATYELQPIKKWTLLKEYYAVKKDGTLDAKDPKALAVVIDLQEQVIESYAEIYEKYKEDKTLDIVFQESCAITSMETFGRLLLDNQHLSKEDFKRLLIKAQKGSPTPSAMVYLYAKEDDINTQKERIKTRGREEENGISDEYLKGLNKKILTLYTSHKLGDHWVNALYFDTKYTTPDQAGDFVFKYFNILYNCTSRKQHVSLEGCLGTGKTTLGNYLNKKSQLPMRFYEQRLTENIIEKLEEKYNNPTKDSIFNLQEAFINEYKKTFLESKEDVEHREFLLYKYMNLPKSSPINVFEAVFSISEVFAKHHYEIGDITKEQYENLCNHESISLAEMKDSIKMVVHLKGSAKEVMSRIETRGRTCERSVGKEFITSISDKYDSLIYRLEITSTNEPRERYAPLMNVCIMEIGPNVTLEYLKEEIDRKYRQYYFCN